MPPTSCRGLSGVGFCLVALTAAPALAEIASIAGSAAAQVQEFRGRQPGDFESASDDFPGTSASLPLQVAATLTAAAPERAATSAAAQFADPRTLDQPNPEEFAINLALSSETSGVWYESSAEVEELRSIVLSADELGGAATGEPVSVLGQFFLDGALTIFSSDSARDLSGAFVTLRATVTQERDGQPDHVVFAGELTISGLPDGQVQISAAGDIPTSTLVLSDLSVSTEELDSFVVLIIPNLELEYAYEALVGEEFRLRASISVEAANIPGVGVSGLLGTPVDSLTDVLEATRGEESSDRMLNALQKEREQPTGERAIDNGETATPPPLLNLCGLLGWESVCCAVLVPLVLRRRATTQRWNEAGNPGSRVD
jgi:hypothetical protein